MRYAALPEVFVAHCAALPAYAAAGGDAGAQGAGTAPGGEGAGAQGGRADDIVDAEFEEVDDRSERDRDK